MPRLLSRSFVVIRQSGDMRAQPIGIIDYSHASANLHDDVIPGRDDFAMLNLRLIPRRGYVSIGSLKHNQDFRVLQTLPVFVGPRKVSL